MHQIGQHAHRFNHFRIAQVVGRQIIGGHRHRIGFSQRLAGHHLIDIGQHQQNRGANQRKDAERWLEQENDDQIYRKPRRIKKCKQAVTGQELTDIRQILHRLAGIGAAFFQILFECGGIDAFVQCHVQARTDPHQHEASDEFQCTHEQVGAQHHEGQHQQRDFVAAGQNAVVHLQHVQRGHQHQQIDDGAENTDGLESALETGQHLADFVLGKFEFGDHLGLGHVKVQKRHVCSRKRCFIL